MTTLTTVAILLGAGLVTVFTCFVALRTMQLIHVCLAAQSDLARELRALFRQMRDDDDDDAVA